MDNLQNLTSYISMYNAYMKLQESNHPNLYAALILFAIPFVFVLYLILFWPTDISKYNDDELSCESANTDINVDYRPTIIDLIETQTVLYSVQRQSRISEIRLSHNFIHKSNREMERIKLETDHELGMMDIRNNHQINVMFLLWVQIEIKSLASGPEIDD